MKTQKIIRIIAIGAVIALVVGLSLAGCATAVPIKSVRMPTINGMDTVKNLAIKDFENKSGVGGTLGAQLTQYLTDKMKFTILATGKFTMVSTTDPNADGVFFGELRNVSSQDTSKQDSYKNKDGDTIYYTTYTRTVTVSFVYGVRSSRTGMELGVIAKQGSTSSYARDDSSQLTNSLVLAQRIVDSQMKTLQQDLVPTIVSTNRTLMSETSKDKTVKQLMKAVQELVKNGSYEEAIRQYDDIAGKYGSIAAGANANILREAIASDTATSARMAQLDSERSGLADKAVKNTVESLNSKLPSGAIIMIMKTSSTEINMLNDVVDQITTAVVQAKKLKVVDRANQALINAEQQFQMSGNVSDNTAVSIGKQLGASYIVLCWISGASSSRRLNFRVLSVETGQIADQTNFEI
jgi:TolB-like protein